MDLSFGADDEAFRAEVRDFLAREWSPIARSPDAEALQTFRGRATAQGYFYRAIPRRYGGSEQPADPVRANIAREEFARARAPGELTTPGVKMLVPTLLERGTDAQKAAFVPKTLTGEYLWCQGYSEPGAGSDLASLKSRAVLDGDVWRIDGHKIWTSRAKTAHFMFILVQTEFDKPKHERLSYLLLDMRQPGVTVRPLKQISGDSSFNEVFLDDVRTPADWIVGARGQGWSVSHTTLKHERNSIGSASTTEALFDKLVKLAQTTRRHNRPLIENEAVRQRLAKLEGVVMAQKYMAHNQLSMAADGRETPRANAINKLVATDIGHEVAGIAQMILGETALSMPTGERSGPYAEAKWMNQIFGSLGVSIAGGASNIQRNIIAERVLGLPREDQPA